MIIMSLFFLRNLHLLMVKLLAQMILESSQLGMKKKNRILAFNVSTDLEGAGTVSNHLIVQPFNEIQVGLGRYDEDPDEYEHPDDSSYDTVEYVSDETTAQIEINDIEAFDEDD